MAALLIVDTPISAHSTNTMAAKGTAPHIRDDSTAISSSIHKHRTLLTPLSSIENQNKIKERRAKLNYVKSDLIIGSPPASQPPAYYSIY